MSEKVKNIIEKVAGPLSLFASGGTLLCCGLPTLFVSLGLGAVVASTVSAFPFLITLSRHKSWMFLGAGALLIGNYFWGYKKIKMRNCEPGTACHPDSALSRRNKVLYLTSWVLYLIAFYIAYLSVPVLNFFGG